MENELSHKELLSILEDVCTLNPKKLIFTGGEPLLYENCIELAQAFKKKSREKICLCLNTNGTLINEQNAYEIVKIFDEIRISLDGFKKENDRLRGEFTFESAMRAFRYTINAGGDPIAFITVTSKNVNYLKDFMEFLLINGISKIHFSPLKLAGRAKDDRMLCDFENVNRMVNDFWGNHFGIFIESEKKNDILNCGVCKFLTVYPNGSVYPCHLLAYPEFCLGNVREDNLFSICHNSSLMNGLRNLDLNKIKRLKIRNGECLGKNSHDKNFREQLLNQIDKTRAN